VGGRTKPNFIIGIMGAAAAGMGCPAPWRSAQLCSTPAATPRPPSE